MSLILVGYREQNHGNIANTKTGGDLVTLTLNQWDALCYYCDDGLAEAGRVEMWRGGFSSGISVNPPLSIGGALLS
ncbi:MULTISPECIES: hypothetical protein [Enterobacter]|uniref:hypothetical protein n=1 Tax=Enterobacter TaxID=547 RepID=UPI00155A66F3|nr:MULTISPECIES: hypothetical protein [Enterobacter]MCG7803979.1 hypothetical protein [Enterobacter asburiae]UAN18769.1 hypothetical protein KGP20_24025 [Enterobacter asburiae]UAN24656.1 hypothetical protein KGP25_25045 [Enterobacter sp. JBIWA003]UAN34202.1 hypothetical protein KGP22_22580 [Enterobacter sp. JBIWA005]UKU10108.1 hypothetical protein [Enterobacter asburiae]